MIAHVSIRNYKSLANVEVDLGPLTVLVGQNGTGKSNFVDALDFVSDANTVGLEQAITDRDGINSIRRYSGKGRQYDVLLSLQFQIEDHRGEYSVTLKGQRRNEYSIKSERCFVEGVGYELDGNERMIRNRDGGDIFPQIPELEPTTLALPIYRSIESLAPLQNIWRFIAGITNYNILPDALRSPHKEYADLRLLGNANNIGSVLVRLQKESAQSFQDISDRLAALVPGIVGMSVQQIAEFVVIRLKHKDSNGVSTFDLALESVGTLRLLGILTALYQDHPPSLLMLEEPELNVHPGVLEILSDVTKEASLRSQVIITTHSPDLIACFDPADVRVVEKIDGATQIAPLEEGQMEAVRKKLFSTGELMLLEGLRGQPQS